MSELAPTASPRPPGVRCDRRAWVRHACSHEVFCQSGAARSGVHWPARVENISAGGLSLVLQHRVQEGMLLAIALQPARRCSFSVLARVVRLTVVSAHPGLRWEVGCEFVRPLDEETLAALFDEFDAS